MGDYVPPEYDKSAFNCPHSEVILGSVQKSIRD